MSLAHKVDDGYDLEHPANGQKLCTMEAEAAVKEVAFGLRDIRISESLPFTSMLAYLNLLTLEGDRLCIEISAAGFRPVGILYASFL